MHDLSPNAGPTQGQPTPEPMVDHGVELLPGVFAKGHYPENLPMLPRLMLRRCDLRGASCLDIGTMEGLLPTLMCRGGASKVVAVDALDHCLAKLNAVKHYYGVDFEYRSVGLFYNLGQRLAGQYFDVLNCSGVLYHVFSPLIILAGLRSLLKKNGLMIVSTNVIADDSYTMEFNDKGRMQVEANTFWYVSIPLLDYMLRYLKLAPIDFIYVPHNAMTVNFDINFNRPSGHLSLVCRAMDDVVSTADDAWMTASAAKSWEYNGLVQWGLAAAAPVSNIRYKRDIDPRFARPGLPALDVWRAVAATDPAPASVSESDSYNLRLADME